MCTSLFALFVPFFWEVLSNCKFDLCLLLEEMLVARNIRSFLCNFDVIRWPLVLDDMLANK